MFERRRELLFVYSVKDANPNGDPLNANHPRLDEGSGQILVSDVRIKRTVRDQWLREGKNVFVDGEAQTLNERFKKLQASCGTMGDAKKLLAQCIDSRLFGVTFASKEKKESFSWTGPAQFKWGRSLHRAKAQFVQGTAAFATKDDSEQRSFRAEYLVPFVVLATYGIANQYPSRDTQATEEDLDALREALWKGTENLITRSKIGHTPLFLLEVTYRKGFDGIAGALDEKICLRDASGMPLDAEAQLALRSLDGVRLDVGKAAEAVVRHLQDVERVLCRRASPLSLSGEEAFAALHERWVREER